MPLVLRLSACCICRFNYGGDTVGTLTAGLLASNIEGWHLARNLIDGSTDQAQYVKLIEEAGELAGNIARGKCVKDDIGDMVVVLINIAKRNGHTLAECMETAWDDIKDRRGEMREGVFIKEDDLAVTVSSYIPIGATHTSAHIQFLREGEKFWSYFKEGEWRILSGEPIGELTELN